MKKKKVLGILLSFSLVFGMSLPGTLAVSVDTDNTQREITVDNELTEKEASDTILENEIGQENTVDNDAEGVNEKSTDSVPEEKIDDKTDDKTDEEKQEDTEITGDMEEQETGETENTNTAATEPSLFEQLIASKSLEEFDKIVDAATEEELNALTDEQNTRIEEHLQSIEPAPAPAVVIDDTIDETVPSEIIYPTVSFSNVAPFGEPVVGENN